MVIKEQKASGILSQALRSRGARGGVAPLSVDVPYFADESF